VKIFINIHKKKSIVIGPQKKSRTCDEVHDEHELETPPALKESPPEAGAEAREDLSASYLHVEIF
jgi:hypothetical protein